MLLEFVILISVIVALKRIYLQDICLSARQVLRSDGLIELEIIFF